MTRPLIDLHDVELAALAAAGGRGEFGELVRRHSSTVRGLLRRMGAQASEADDISQDAFIIAFQRCADFRGEGTFSSWVKRIAVRLFLRRKVKEGRYTEEITDDEVAPAADRGGLVDLDEALKDLNGPERVCVSLCHGAGMSHAEIAAATKMPLGTVKSHVKRGLAKLRARLAPGYLENGRGQHVSR